MPTTAISSRAGRRRKRPAPTFPAVNRPLLQLTAASTLLPVVQAKLRVGLPNDACEKQADRVAAGVLHTSEPRNPLRVCAVDAIRQPPADGWQKAAKRCPACGGEPVSRRQPIQGESAEMLRAKGSTKNAAVPLPGFEAQFHAAKPEGQALPRAVRDYFEPRMGFDFGQVKIHAGNQARRLNEAVMARAFTCGSHVFLDADAVEFSSASGRRLLAHELTHVMQQDGVGGSLIQRQPAPANDEFASKGPVAKAREDVGNALLIASRKLDQAIKNRDNNSILPPDVFGAYRRFFGESDLEKLEKLEVLKVRIDEAAGWIATMPFDIIPNPVPAGYRDEAIHRLALAGGAQHATAMQPPLSGGDMYIAIYPPWYADASMRAPKVLHELFHFFPDVRHAVAPARTEPPWQNARAYQGFVGTLAGLTEGAQLGGMFPP